MTTIAWDGKTLAGDRQSTYGNTPTRTKKVFRHFNPNHGTVLLGFCGLTSEANEFIRWVRGERETAPVLKDIGIIAIDEKYHIWVSDQTLNWAKVGFKVWACGLGSDYALGAMLAGKSAKEAIQIAMRLDNLTGLGVDCVRF